jgi:hypothetical protein
MLAQPAHREHKELQVLPEQVVLRDYREIQVQPVCRAIPALQAWEQPALQVPWVQQDQVTVPPAPADQREQQVPPERRVFRGLQEQLVQPVCKAYKVMLVQQVHRVFKVLPALRECREMQELLVQKVQRAFRAYKEMWVLPVLAQRELQVLWA